MVSAERCSGSRHRWSGIRAPATQLRQYRRVASTFSHASSAEVGRSSPSAQDSAQYARSPACSACLPRTRSSSTPIAQVGLQPDVLPGAGRVRVEQVLAEQRPLRRRMPVVEHRLAHELDLDPTLDALDDAHQEVVRVVVGRRPGVRGDGVLGGAARHHRQRVVHEHPAARRAPGRLQRVRARRVAPGDGMVDAVRTEAEASALPVQQAPEHARRVERGHAQPVDRAVRRR